MTTKTTVIAAALIAAVLVGGAVMTTYRGDSLSESQVRMITQEVVQQLGGPTTFDELQLGNVISDTHALSIRRDQATSTASWRNTTGGDVWITDWHFAVDGRASSSFRAFVGTSTLSATSTYLRGVGTYTMGDGFNPFAFGNNAEGNVNCIMCGFLIATSTTATTTSSNSPRDIRSFADLLGVNNDQMATNSPVAIHGSSSIPFDAGTNTPRFWRVRNLEYVQMFIRQESKYACISPGTNCDTATDTDRGIDTTFWFETVATTSIMNDPYPVQP
jgi:hypothetical protein